MSTYENSKKSITLSFIIVSLLLIFLGTISIIKMIELSNLTKQLYEHPLRVINATQNIQVHLVSMHRYMKDVVLASNKEELQTALNLVNENEKMIYKDFEIVFDKYLGDKKEIQRSYDLFVAWKSIRNEIVELMNKGKISEAIYITKHKGYQHVLKLNKSVDILVAYAHKKGEHFVSYANQTKDLSISLILAVVMIILALIFSILIVLLKSLATSIRRREQETQQLLSQSRLAQMGEMISMIAHQWRQPLGAIASTSIDMKMKIELEKFDLSDEKSRGECLTYINVSLDNIAEFVQNLTNTIDDFRDFYKANKKKENLYITIPIKKTFNIIENSFKANNIEIIHNYYATKKAIFNNNEIMQVLLNIFQNAEDNFRVNSIKSACIWITTMDTKEGVCIKICDNGGGIDEKIIDKIFDPYFSTKHERNGTGLGLYMSKLIIEDHHDGKIRTRNTKVGACFEIELADK